MEGLSRVCAGLGFVERDKFTSEPIFYEKGDDCLDSLKELLRFFRRDDPQSREVFKQVCKWKTASKNLIPIMEYFPEDRHLVLNAVKVLVFLTMPVDPSSSDIPQQIEYLWELKSDITSSCVIGVIVSLLLEIPIVNLENEAFTEDDWKVVQLVLTLFRNLLAIQDITTLQKSGGSASHFISLRDRFLELLFQENVMDSILTLTQHVEGSRGYLREHNLLLLETFHYIFMGQDAELIARAQLKDSKEEENATSSLENLKSILKEEKEKRKLFKMQNTCRHSQFSGTFSRLTMDGSKTLLKGNPSFSSDPLIKPQKAYRGPLKRVVWDHEKFPTQNSKILELLKGFSDQFLSGGYYNVLMQSIREDIEKEHPSIQNNDVVLFFRLAHFIMSFQYHKLLKYKRNMDNDSFEAFADKYSDNTLFKGDICGPIAASMNESMFQLVISKWRCAFDGLKETGDYKFLSSAGSLMKTMIDMLFLVLKNSPSNSNEPKTVRVLLYKLFYDQTEEGVTRFLFNLIKSFQFHKQPKSDLADLVEMTHVIIRLMENLQAHGTLRVSKISRKRKQKKEKKEIIDQANGNNETANNEINTAGCESINIKISGKENVNKQSAMLKEDESFLAHGDENNICKAKMSNLEDTVVDTYTNPELPNDGAADSSSDEQATMTAEVDFKVSTVISAIANSIFVHNLCWLLKFYKSNTASTNHHIICMLRRICDDLELSPMLYQLSLLTTFYGILAEQMSSPCKDYEDIVNFLTSLVRRMLRKIKNQPLLFVELLFWKTQRECHDINADSLLYELGSLRKGSRHWAGFSHDGHFGSSQVNGDVRRNIADALGDDEADVVISSELHDQREEDQYNDMDQDNHEAENVMESMTSNDNCKEDTNNERNSGKHDLQKPQKRRKRVIVNAELDTKVKDLYEKYKGTRHCSRLVAEDLGLNEFSPAQVSNILKRLGLKCTKTKYTVGDKYHENGKPLESDHSLQSKAIERPVRKASKESSGFSHEQEMMIISLFEKFKDHKRCAYMISNELDCDGAFSAIQVSRKLKQLGLSTALHRDSKIHTNLIDEDLNDLLLPGDLQSPDDETLLSSLKKRKRKSKMEKDEKLVEALDRRHENKDVLEGHEHGQPIHGRVEEIDEIVGLSNVNNIDVSDAEATSISSEEDSDVEPVPSVGNLSASASASLEQSHNDLADVLEDSGGQEVGPVALPKASSRRRFRMVIDNEDE